MPAAPDPSLARMVFCAVLVLAFALGVWVLIDRRSAPPPPPKIELPGR